MTDVAHENLNIQKMFKYAFKQSDVFLNSGFLRTRKNRIMAVELKAENLDGQTVAPIS